MTGLDFSPASLSLAQDLAGRVGADVDFVESDVYDAVETLGRTDFDLVFTGIGALCWLPNIRRWAEVVARLLRPGGRLFLREGHPILWALSEPREDGLLVVEYPYFEREEPLVWDQNSTYVQTDARLSATVTHEWNHGLGEIVTALQCAGLTLTALVEHDSVPYEAFPGSMERLDNGEWQLIKARWRLPLSYTLQAGKPA
ncbi:Methyltransferase domain-containing protein [Singulisphaera sp. GP187]|nr:class I SAM-dependent methyltransferase [Singulisphaera sp. GP187]SIO44445.1 Methyltransferase domain-containing protein [Singulisphaera sp. GP187]